MLKKKSVTFQNYEREPIGTKLLGQHQHHFSLSYGSTMWCFEQDSLNINFWMVSTALAIAYNVGRQRIWLITPKNVTNSWHGAFPYPVAHCGGTAIHYRVNPVKLILYICMCLFQDAFVVVGFHGTLPKGLQHTKMLGMATKRSNHHP